MSNIDKQALREAAERASTDNHTQDEWYHYLRCSTPATVLALLDELEAEPAIHRWRRVTVEPYGPYPWHYGNFIGFSKPVEGIEGEYFYSAPPAPSVDEDLLHMAASAIDDLLSNKDRSGAGVWVDIPAKLRRAAMLQGAEPVSNRDELPYDPQIAAYEKIMEQAIPDGWVMVPMKLTAENGAKGALLGEFSETKFINCPECFGDDECDTCDGSGRIETKVQVSWTNIKAIWAKGIEHFSAAPQQEVKP